MSALAGCAAEEVDPADEPDEADDAETDDADDDDSNDGEGDDATDDDADDAEPEDGDEAEVDDADDASVEDDDDNVDDTDDDADDADDGSEDADEDQDTEDDEDDDQAEVEDDEDDGGDDPDGDDESADEGDGETDEEDDDADADDDSDEDADDGEEADEPDVSAITLEVVGPAGEPIEGADVTGEGEPHEADIPLEFSGETDAGGEYADEIYENEYTIEVEHPEYEAETVGHTHDGDSEVGVELDAAVDTASITVTVVGPAGERIEGAEVIGEGEPHEADIPLEFSGETDADGEYTDVIYENEYAIEADHPDYEAAVVSHSHGGDSEVRVELGSGVDTSRLTLTISDPDGDPIEGATIAGEGKHSRSEGIPLEFSGETDADGEYTDVIYENNYVVEIDHPEYLSRAIDFIHAEGTDLSLTLDPR